MKKGITPIITTVLLLLIAIAIIGIAFGWFVGIFNTASSSGEDAITNLNINKRAVLESVTCLPTATDAGNVDGLLTAYIKASGTDNLAIGSVSIYLDNVLVGSNPAQLTSGAAASAVIVNLTTRTTTPTTCAAGNVVKITDPAGTSSQKTLS